MKTIWYYLLKDLHDIADRLAVFFVVLVFLMAICFPVWASIHLARYAIRALVPACATSTDCAPCPRVPDTWSSRRYEFCPGEGLIASGRYVI